MSTTELNAMETQTGRELGRLCLLIAEGDPAAYRFCLSISPVSKTWDHVIDEDLPMDKEESDAAFMALVLDWPINPFVRAHAAVLVPVMAAAVNAWRCSTLPGCRIKAYDALSETWSVVAFILGGWERVNRVMPDVRAALAAQAVANDEKD